MNLEISWGSTSDKNNSPVPETLEGAMLACFPFLATALKKRDL